MVGADEPKGRSDTAPNWNPNGRLNIRAWRYRILVGRHKARGGVMARNAIGSPAVLSPGGEHKLAISVYVGIRCAVRVGLNFTVAPAIPTEFITPISRIRRRAR